MSSSDDNTSDPSPCKKMKLEKSGDSLEFSETDQVFNSTDVLMVSIVSESLQKLRVDKIFMPLGNSGLAVMFKLAAKSSVQSCWSETNRMSRDQEDGDRRLLKRSNLVTNDHDFGKYSSIISLMVGIF